MIKEVKIGHYYKELNDETVIKIIKQLPDQPDESFVYEFETIEGNPETPYIKNGSGHNLMHLGREHGWELIEINYYNSPLWKVLND